MTTPDLERRIRTWFADEIGEAEAAPSSVHAFLGAIPQSMPREQGLFGRRTFVLLAAAALLVTLLAGAIGVGSGIIKLPSLVPVPSVVADPSAEATPSSSVEPSPDEPLGLVAYLVATTLQAGQGGCIEGSPSRCSVSRIWIADLDGSGAHELMPGQFQNQRLVGWSPDGSEVLYWDSFGSPATISFTNLDGDVVRAVDIGCETPCYNDSDFTLSPDGAHIAFVRTFGSPENEQAGTVVAVMDWATGEVVELDSTRTQNEGTDPSCGDCGGLNELPRWSPDGTRLTFSRQGIPDDTQIRGSTLAVGTAIFVVDSDGGNLRELVDRGLYARDAQWSPDGELVVFVSSMLSFTPRSVSGPGDATLEQHQVDDIYTVRPDGTALTRLTTTSSGPLVEVRGETGDVRPTWTSDGLIVFIYVPPADESGTVNWELWVMDADGTDGQQLDPEDLSRLTAIGCITCPYQPGAEGLPTAAIWMPTR